MGLLLKGYSDLMIELFIVPMLCEPLISQPIDACLQQNPNLAGLQYPNLAGLQYPNLAGLQYPNLAGLQYPNLAGLQYPNLAGLQYPNLAGLQYPNLAGLQLADWADQESALDVDVLIGADYYWDLDEIVHRMYTLSIMWT